MLVPVSDISPATRADPSHLGITLIVFTPISGSDSADQLVFPAASLVRTLPAAAPFGSRRALALIVPTTSSL
jgi:hypothetical protein